MTELALDLGRLALLRRRFGLAHPAPSREGQGRGLATSPGVRSAAGSLNPNPSPEETGLILGTLST